MPPPSNTDHGSATKSLVTERQKSSPRRAETVKVLYIMGAARCGSTLLDNILNEIDGFFSVGELRFLWDRLSQGRFCGCGQTFPRCEVWSEVLSRVLGPNSPETAPSIAGRMGSIAGTWRTWQLLQQTARSNLPSEVQAHANLMACVYQNVAELTNARVIVDSSKRPWDAALLRVVPNVSSYFVHLVRDPRAMAHSQAKVKVNPDRSELGEMAPTGVSRSALQWLRWNLAADAVRKAVPADHSMLVAYHDLSSDPLAVVQALAAFVGEGHAKLPFLDPHTVWLGGNHTVSGNPDRFRKGAVAVREDAGWKREMPKSGRIVATALTWPLMRRYQKVVRL